MPPFDELIGWFFKLIIAGIMSFLWWGKREDKKLLNSHSKDIVRLQSQAVTEDKVREIVTEATNTAINPMYKTMDDIKTIVTDNSNLVKKLQIKQAVQDGYQQAMKELKAAQDKE